MASRKGHVEILRKLLVLGLDICSTNEADYTSLHWACQEGRLETAEFLLSRGAYIEAQDKVRGYLLSENGL
eukprot:m.178163 g.178163  ORF g.178163 m.178163 type:complete len:71 (+) comp39170_c0_seq38:400-612(+)